MLTDDKGSGRPLPNPQNIGLRRWVTDHVLGSDTLTTLRTDVDAKIAASLLTTRGDMIRRSATAPERFAKGATNTLLVAGANDPDWATLSTLLDAVIGSSRGTILQRGTSAWQALTPGTSGHFLKSNGAGADLSYTAVSQPAWTLIEARTVDGDEDFINLSGYQSIQVILKDVAASASSTRLIRVSTDNGSTFLSASGDYFVIDVNGVETAQAFIQLHTTNSASARSAFAEIHGFNLAGAPKKVSTPQWSTVDTYFVTGTSALNAIRVFNGSGNLTSGTIYLLGLTS